MKKISVLLGVLLFSTALEATPQGQYAVGLLIVATGKYIDWVQSLISSADVHFLPEQRVTYFIFTDSSAHLAYEKQIESTRDVKMLPHKRLGWPYDTLMRPKVYYYYRDALSEMDYLFATDADMRFVDTVGDEILGERVATQHPGYVNRRGTYERRITSTAYVASHEGTCYFAGGFNGGTRSEYLKLCKTVTDNILLDIKNRLVAVWHDESHINRYFIDNPPTIILSPSYCYPESVHLPYHKRLLALDKNHAEMRK